MRLAGRGGIARALYVAATEQRVVVVRMFVKNTRRTPRREIEVALRREGGIAVTTVAELHERWSRDADYREAYVRLEPELEVARALVEARTRGVHPSGVGGSNGDDTIGGGVDGEWAGAAVDEDAGEGRASDG